MTQQWFDIQLNQPTSPNQSSKLHAPIGTGKDGLAPYSRQAV